MAAKFCGQEKAPAGRLAWSAVTGLCFNYPLVGRPPLSPGDGHQEQRPRSCLDIISSGFVSFPADSE